MTLKKLEPEFYWLAVMIREAREALGMSQKMMGDALGMARSSVNCIETCTQRVPFHDAVRIAHFLKIDLNEIVHKYAESEAALEVKQRLKAMVIKEVEAKKAAYADSLEVLAALDRRDQ